MFVSEIYIHDIDLKFTDDTKVIMSYRERGTLQADLDLLLDCPNQWHIKFNIYHCDAFWL